MNLLFILLAFISNSQAATPVQSSKSVLDKTFKWDSTLVRLRLELPADWNDKGDYTDLILSAKGLPTLHVKNLQNVEVDSKIQLPEKTDRLNKDAYLISLNEKNTLHALIVMQWLGGSSPDSVWVITKDNSGFHSDSKTLYDQRLFAIRDYNGDGKFDLLIHGGLGEPTGADNYSYDPYQVYVQTSDTKTVSFKYDEMLSKKWSEENHYEWHGNHYNEKLRVNQFGKAIEK